MAVLLLPSAVLANLCFFLSFRQPDDFYRHGYLAWSNLLAVAALYVLATQQLLRMRKTCR
jgi:endonuclease/exonuclease/phosphatase (EEP) superfamily protein YafD